MAMSVRSTSGRHSARMSIASAARGVARHATRRQAHRERGAVAWPVAVRDDGPAVRFDDVPHDGKAKTEPADRARGGVIALSEWLEHVRKKLRGDARTGVLHAD